MRTFKVFNEINETLEEPLWEHNPELAIIDTILTTHPAIYDIVKDEVMEGCKKSNKGRQDKPTVEQVVRAAIYKELRSLTYRELEYMQHDSKICPIFLKLGKREPFSFKVFQKYISKISVESLEKVMIEINKIVIEEKIEDLQKIRPDSTAIETNIHYPTNNALVWDGIKEIDRLLGKLKKSLGKIRIRRHSRAAKKNYAKINYSKSKDKRKELFKKQLKILKGSINQSKRVVDGLENEGNLSEAEELIKKELENILPKIEKVYDISYRHELLDESVPNKDKIFSIYEDHTDIIKKGNREVVFGHKVNFTSGKSNLILDCKILNGNPKDSESYEGIIERVKNNYNRTPRDIASDGGYCSSGNLEAAKKEGIINIVFNKVVGSVQNQVSSKNMETRLKKWRSGIEAIISNIKRGFGLYRCEWKTKKHFDAKVLWSVIAYNIRIITRHVIGGLEGQLTKLEA